MASGTTITITGGTDMVQVVAGVDAIEAADYNKPRTNIDTLLGPPADVTLGTFTASSTFGFNQGGSAENAQSVGDLVTAAGIAANQDGFKDLQDEVQELALFLGITPSPAVNDVTSGDTITASDWNAVMLAVEDCWNLRFSHAPSAAVTATSAQFTSAWTNTITSETTFTFSNEQNCRAFFNGGGEIGLLLSRTGGGVNDQNSRWTETFNALGDISLTHDTTLAGSGTIAGIGFYELTAAYQQLVEKFTVTAPYTGDFVQINAKVNSVTNPTVVTLQFVATDAGDGVVDASPDGTLTVAARNRLPNVTGTGYVFATPTVGAGAITGS